MAWWLLLWVEKKVHESASVPGLIQLILTFRWWRLRVRTWVVVAADVVVVCGVTLVEACGWSCCCCSACCAKNCCCWYCIAAAATRCMIEEVRWFCTTCQTYLSGVRTILLKLRIPSIDVRVLTPQISLASGGLLSSKHAVWVIIQTWHCLCKDIH